MIRLVATLVLAVVLSSGALTDTSVAKRKSNRHTSIYTMRVVDKRGKSKLAFPRKSKHRPVIKRLSFMK